MVSRSELPQRVGRYGEGVHRGGLARRLRRPPLGLLLAVFILGLFAVSASAQKPIIDGGVCQRFDVAELASVASPIWVATRSQILVPDTAAQRVVALLGNGKSAGPLYDEVSAITFADQVNAFGFGQIGDEFLQFQNTSSGVTVVWLGRYLKPQGEYSLLESSPESDILIVSVIDWTLAGEYLVGFGGYVYTANREFGMGFFYHRLQHPKTGLRGTSRLLFPFPEPKYYLGYEKYFTAIGDTAYFLQMKEGEPPQLLRINPSANETQATVIDEFPRNDKRLPYLEGEVGGPDEYLQVRQPQLDEADLIRGLYSQDELMYALYRNPKKGWQLEQQAPGRDAVETLGTMTIPSAARNISLLPTDKRWFIFEHPDKVRAKKIPSMIVIPESLVTYADESPLYAPGAKWIRCANL